MRILTLITAALLFISASPCRAEVFVSEFLASNQSGTVDEDGSTSDWIEIHNPDAGTVNLNGWALTDNAAVPQKWIFPSVSLASGQFLRVWASAKNRRVAGSPLHTNFSLNADGDYLALVRPDGTIRQDFGPSFPKQDPDRSFGISFQGTPLIQTGTTLKYLVPTGDALGTTWTQTAFDPAGWTNGTNGVGFGVLTPGMTVRVVKKNTSFGQITTLAQTDAILNPANASQIAQQYTQVLPVLNLLGEGGDGRYGNNTPVTLADPNHYAVQATGFLNVTSGGTFTFGLNSDDGGRIRINGANVMVDNTNHGPADHLGTVNLAPGLHSFEAVMWEAGGGDEVEFFVARGTHTVWSAANFALVGQSSALGIQVLTPPQGSGGGEAGSYVQTNLETPMRHVRSSVFLRIPFQVEDPAAFSSLLLNMRYADGFEASLNGQPVAARNAPTTLAYNSAATATRTAVQALTAESINLNAQLGQLVAGENMLAIHGMNNSAADSLFLAHAELSGGGFNLAQVVYFNSPTPLATNSTPSSFGKVADTVFSPTRGFYPNATTPATPVRVRIVCATPGAVIRYTTDGSEPSATNGTIYTGPISVAATTVIRAMASKVNFDSTNVDTHTYIFPDEVLTQSATGTPPPGWPTGPVNGQVLDYGMDPDIVNHTNPNLGGRTQVKSALAAIPTICLTANKDDLFGGSGIYVNAGGRGFAWERRANIELMNHAEGELSELCGVRVRGGYSRSSANPKHSFHLYFRGDYGKSKLRFPLFGENGTDEFDAIDFRTAQNYSWSFHGDGNNTFLREEFSRATQGDMGQQHARGFYFHLYLNGQYWGLFATQERPEAGHAEAYYGGTQEDYDVVKSSGSPGGYTTENTNGTMAAWQNLWNQAVAHSTAPQAELIQRYFRMQGLAPDGRTRLNPATDPCLLDVNNQIDYMLIVFHTGSSDAPLTGGGNAVNNWFTYRDRTKNLGFLHFAHDMEHSCFGGDRTGPFSNGNLTNFSYSNPQYIHQHLLSNPEYRLRFADRTWKHLFNNGALTTQANVDRTNRLAATVGSAIIAESARWGDAQSPTAPRTKADWENARNGLLNYFQNRNQEVINQLVADGLYVTSPGGVTPSRWGGYITSTTPLALSANASIYYTTNGSDPRLVGGAINTPSAVQFIGGTTTSSTLVDWGRDAAGANWKYRDPSIDLGSSGIVVGHASYNATNWKHPQFADTGVEWKSGDAELGATDAPRTAINVGPTGARYPALYFRKKFTVVNPSQFDALSLEVKRDDGAIIYINGREVGRTNMPAGDLAFDYIPNNVVGGTDEETFFPVVDPRLVPSVLVDGENVICVEVHQANSGSSDLTFDLRLQGTKTAFAQPIFLTQPGLVTLKARSTNGTSWGPLTETQFIVNAVPASISNLVVTEIMYHPSDPTSAEIAAGFDNDGDFEFIELINIGATAIDLINVRFTAGITFDFDQSHLSRFLNPGQRVLLVSNSAAFVSRYGSGFPVAGQFGGSLDNIGETLTLVDATDGTVKNFTYGTEGLWPQETDGAGFSLILKNPTSNPDPANAANWRSSVGTSGNPNQSDATSFTAWMTANNLLSATGDVDNDRLNHVLEYALGSDPNQADGHRMPAIGMEELPDGLHPTITFSQRLSADDCEWIPEAGTDLIEFQASLLEQSGRTNNGDGTVTLTYRSVAPQTDVSSFFLRLRVVVAP